MRKSSFAPSLPDGRISRIGKPEGLHHESHRKFWFKASNRNPFAHENSIQDEQNHVRGIAICSSTDGQSNVGLMTKSTSASSFDKAAESNGCNDRETKQASRNLLLKAAKLISMSKRRLTADNHSAEFTSTHPVKFLLRIHCSLFTYLRPFWDLFLPNNSIQFLGVLQ